MGEVVTEMGGSQVGGARWDCTSTRHAQRVRTRVCASEQASSSFQSMTSSLGGHTMWGVKTSALAAPGGRWVSAQVDGTPWRTFRAAGAPGRR